VAEPPVEDDRTVRERTADRIEQARESATQQVEQARLTARRLFGLDRSGPVPPETVAGAPLRPWTIPNAIGYARALCLIGFWIVLAGDDDGVSVLAAVLFFIAGAGDYWDGIAARITRQYSRLGALMDPVLDRLVVISGVLACWHFDLQPHWALALLLIREVAMLLIARFGLRHGVDLKINWPGRLGVGPIMGGLWFPMIGLETLGRVMLYAGLVLVWLATVLYLRSGLAAMRARRDAAE
jgi:phosphatidylglycerophosphate synthase